MLWGSVSDGSREWLSKGEKGTCYSGLHCESCLPSKTKYWCSGDYWCLCRSSLASMDSGVVAGRGLEGNVRWICSEIRSSGQEGLFIRDSSLCCLQISMPVEYRPRGYMQ